MFLLFLSVCLLSACLAFSTAAVTDVSDAVVMYVDSSTALVKDAERYIDDDKAVVPVRYITVA